MVLNCLALACGFPVIRDRASKSTSRGAEEKLVEEEPFINAIKTIVEEADLEGQLHLDPWDRTRFTVQTRPCFPPKHYEEKQDLMATGIALPDLAGHFV